MKGGWKDLSDRGIKIGERKFLSLDTSKYDVEFMGKFVSDVVYNVLTFVAENERNSIKQRQKEGIEIAKVNGVQFGRPAIPYPDDFETVYKEGKMEKLREWVHLRN